MSTTPTPRIVYLDEPTYLTTGFLRQLSRLGTVTVHYDRPGRQETIRRLSAADIALVEWTTLSADVLRQARQLRHVSTLLSATDQIDLVAARQLGIGVSHCPDYSVDAVADYVITSVGALSRQLLPASRMGVAGVRHRYPPFLGRSLSGAVIGLVGTGRIGQAVAQRARAFGMEVLGHNRSGRPVPGIELVGLPELVRRSDVVSVQVPASEETAELLSAELVGALRPGCIVVSVSRAETIAMRALADRHAAGRLGGVALDDVPDGLAPVFARKQNTQITPGIAWYTRASRQDNLTEVLANVRGFLNGEPVNVVA
ncbi:NAD(P)-dependent oxidoreductase [Polymorphospora sp. NPDC050346]|uniref:2-hydroxyacid dehydrogenase n=1 Tax=Polymorphospora sp. NPDC050346 TaxID=3155780 RepID=UPI0033C58F08